MKNLDLIALILLSWVAIWLFEKKNLSVLGLTPTKSRIRYSIILFIVTAAFCSTGFIMRIFFTREVFGLNPQTTGEMIFTGVWMNFKSVLFEELLCRGVGLYLLIKKLGARWAIVISSLIFGFLHIIDPSVMSYPVQSLMIFVFTFTMGLLLAYSYVRTYSLYIPFFIHFG